MTVPKQNVAYSVEGQAGIRFDWVSDKAEFDLGFTQRGNSNRIYVYVQAAGAVTAGGTGTVANTAQTANAPANAQFTPTNTNPTHTSISAMADNQYGWVYRNANIG